MQGGGMYCKCSEITLQSISFNLCNAVNSQAGYFETSVYSQLSLILIYNCFIAGDTTCMGPAIDITNDYDEFLYSPVYDSFNFSYNTVHTEHLTSLFSMKCIGNGFDYFSMIFMSLFTFYENVCPTEIECQGKDGSVMYLDYFNMIQNHISKSVFVVSGENYLFCSQCFIGRDYNVFYFPKQTPYPTETPYQTMLIPTPPKFLPDYARRIEDDKEDNAKHYEYIFNTKKNKFEKVFSVPESKVQKYLNEIEKKNGRRPHESYGQAGNKRRVNSNDERTSDRYALNKDSVKNDGYFSVDPNRNFFIREKPNIVLALFPESIGSIFFSESKIDYAEMDFVDCEDQCYIHDFETFPIEEHTLIEFDVSYSVEEETTGVQKDINVRFPTDAMNVTIICIIIAATLILYVAVMSVACVRLRIRRENELDENNNNAV